jgi:acyl-CoA synthetase (AMP-forming)/AMP-acid ligase II
LEVPDIDKYDKSSLFELNSGAGICPSELKKRILEKFPGTLFSDQFGQTEMSPIAISKWDSSADLEKISDRDLGVPLTTIEMRVVNEKGEDVKPGEIGEIIYKSPTVMKEYYKDEEKTRKTITDGYFHSGDLGYFDENGKLRLVDRASEMINVGGENVYPHEVEEILETNQKVEYAALLGVKDEEYGQVPMALIKLREGEKATEEEIIDFCRGKMSGIKRPRFVEFVEEFPINPVGKIERRKAKEKFEEVMEEGHRRWRKERR